MSFSEGTLDPRVRRFVLPSRVLWTTPHGVAAPENLLAEGDDACVLTPGPGEPPGVLLDFGRELHGGLRLEVPVTSTGRPARVRVRFGESASEAMGTPNNDHSIHDFDLPVPWFGHIEVGNTGFRFARIDLLDHEAAVSLRQAKAVFLYRPLEYLGSFKCSDPLLNRIWETGAYTVHLCLQDYLWDGIKRDRLVWIGDLYPEMRVVNAVFGEVDAVPRSLDFARDHTPLTATAGQTGAGHAAEGGTRWMNGISSYSLWWILSQRDWYRYHGNRGYLEEQRGYLLGLLELVESRIGEDGTEQLDGWRFLEWPTAEDPAAIAVGLQALAVLALRAGGELCRVLGETEAASRAEAAAARAAARRREPSLSKQANALAVLAGMADPGEANRSLLARDPYRGLSTFFGFYVLQARALARDYEGCLDLIRRYWGPMLDLGATTFWEHFEVDWLENAGRIDELVPEGKVDVHADRGAYCFQGLRHSLCHGWAAGPTAWLSEHVLGLSPAAPGFGRLSVSPHLAGLDFARGTFPTPQGVVEVSHRRGSDGHVKTSLTVPDGVEVHQP